MKTVLIVAKAAHIFPCWVSYIKGTLIAILGVMFVPTAEYLYTIARRPSLVFHQDSIGKGIERVV